MDQTSPIVLGYWKIRGLAERIRMLLEYLGIHYTQHIYTADNRPQWFQKDKLAMQLKNPAANLPYLIDGEILVCQTDAIMIYLIHKGKKTDMLGRDWKEQVTIATVMGILKDIYKQYIDLTYYGSDPFEEAKKKSMEILKPLLWKLDKMLQDNKYFCGDQLTWADFAVSETIQCIWLLEPTVIESYSTLFFHQKRVYSLPEIEKYHKSERYKERPTNSPYAKWF